MELNQVESMSLLPSNQAQALSEYITIDKYAKYDSKKKRRETWDESVDRVRDMHKQRYGSRGIAAIIDWAFEQVRAKKVLPSMRSMQFGGDAILANDARIYNCSYTFADRARFFSEALWLLLSGVGVGFSVQKHHVAKLPRLIEGHEEKEIFTYVVADTIEGWADALDVLISTYFKGSPLSGKEVFFDFSKIRRKGSWLKTSGGKAPGAKPLKIALKRIKKILRNAVDAKQNQLRPIQVYDITMMAAECVLAGGIRRSATIALFSPGDEEMMTAKTFSKVGKVLTDKRKDGTWLVDYGDGATAAWFLKNEMGAEPSKNEELKINWYNIMPWRARSNNSVLLIRNQCTKEQFEEVIAQSRKFGEPGFVFANSTEDGYNPCVEISMRPVCVETGETGVHFCNLTEVNGGKIKSKEDFKSAVRAASIIGTLQAGYTYLHYLTDASRRIVKREGLLGVSLTGWMDNPKVLLDPATQREMALYAVEVNKEMAAAIGIEAAARVTCTKPAGSTALVCGTGSGIHSQRAKYYFRRTQQNPMDPVFQYFKTWNPQAVEASVWGADDEVVTFCYEAPDGAIYEDDLSAIDFLKIVKQTYENWVLPGTAKPEMTPGLTHNVSNTVKVAEHEWVGLIDYIFDNRQCFSGISLLPKLGDKIYPQAPMEKVETQADIKKWNKLVSEFTPIDWSGFVESEDATMMTAESACAGGACLI